MKKMSQKLVQGKRNLFDNVINPEATEDVVGVSKQMLETLIEDLADSKNELADTSIKESAAIDAG